MCLFIATSIISATRLLNHVSIIIVVVTVVIEIRCRFTSFYLVLVPLAWVGTAKGKHWIHQSL